MRRSLVCAVVLLVALVPVPARSAVPVVVIDGKGYGHGVGMAQEGAFWMGAAGASTEQILGQFYPGAGIGRGRGPVRVPVLDAGAAPSSATVAFPDGGEIREVGSGPTSPGFPVRLAPGAQVRIAWDGARYRVDGPGGSGRESGRSAAPSATKTEGWVLASSTRRQIPTLPPPSSTTSTTAAPPPTPPPPTTTPPPSTTTTSAPPADRPPSTTTPPPPEPSPDTTPSAPPTTAPGPSSGRTLAAIPAEGGAILVPDRQQRYRGFVEATAAATGTLRLVNVVDVETYLKGMGEVRDPTWPPAALRAQAIAARTYALRAMAVGGEVCDTQRCQVYLGAQAEYGAMNKAVDDSREQVLVFGRELISAVYSANGGGHSASQEEGFGVGPELAVPYLRPAPYLTQDPGPWSVTIALTDVGRRLGYAGDVTDVRIARAGPSGRAVEVVLDGSAGPKPVTGIAFDAALGLRSTFFTLRIDTGEPPPPPPAEEVVLQAPPEQAAEVAATETAGATTTVPRPTVGGYESFELREVPEELLIVAGWLVTAALCAAVVVTRKRPAP